MEDKFWGLECKYYFACKRVFVDGVDTGEGIKPLPAKFPVSYIHEYNEKVGVCHIKVGGGLFSWLAGFVKKQNFYSQTRRWKFQKSFNRRFEFQMCKGMICFRNIAVLLLAIGFTSFHSLWK